MWIRGNVCCCVYGNVWFIGDKCNRIEFLDWSQLVGVIRGEDRQLRCENRTIFSFISLSDIFEYMCICN